MDAIFGLVRTWFFLPVLPAKFKYEIDQNWNSSKSIFQNPLFENQVQINREIFFNELYASCFFHKIFLQYVRRQTLER